MKNFTKKFIITLTIATVIILIPFYKLVSIRKKSLKNCSYEEHTYYQKAISDIACKILHKSKNPNEKCVDWCLDQFYNQYDLNIGFLEDLWYFIDESIFNMYNNSNFDNINNKINPICAENPNIFIYGRNEKIYQAIFIYNGSLEYQNSNAHRVDLKIMTFYDKKKEPFIQKYITIKPRTNPKYYEELNIAQYETIKKQLKEYIKNNPKVLDYLIFSQNSEGDIIIYEKLSWTRKVIDPDEQKTYQIFIKFIDVVKNTQQLQFLFDEGYKNIEEDIKRFNQ